MKNTIKHFTLLLFLSLIMTSCGSDEPNNPDDENPTADECFDFKDVMSLTENSGEILYTHFIDDNHGWILTRKNLNSMNLFRTDDGGQTFELLHEDFDIDLSNQPLPILKFINQTEGFTISHIGGNGISGKVAYTTNKGVSWTKIPNPANIDDASVFWKAFDSNSTQTVVMSDLTYVMVINNASKEVTNVIEMPEMFFNNWWHLLGRDIHLSESGVITCLCSDGNTNNSKIIQSSDYGATWTTIFDVENQSLDSMTWPTDQVGYISSLGKLYKTIDGGLNWEIKESLHFSSIDFVNENTGLGVVSSHASEDGFYKTTDGGNTWIVFDCLKPDNTNQYRTGEWISYTSIDNAIFPGFKSDGNFGGDYGLFYYKGE